MRLAKQGLDLAVVVPDLERSLGFYRDTLLLSVSNEMHVPGVGLLVMLDVGETTLKLVQPDTEIEQHPPRGGLRARAGGFRYCTFTIADLDAVLDRCQQRGIPVPAPPAEVAPGVRLAAVEDPDGNWVELMEPTES